MIAASEEFLAEIRPLATHGNHMRAAAIQAAYRFDLNWHLYDPRPLPVFTQARALHGLACIITGMALGVGQTKYRDPQGDAEMVSGMIAEGMPFVGWSIGAESRRIDGPAQPGEGEFIKYFGRASA